MKLRLLVAVFLCASNLAAQASDDKPEATLLWGSLRTPYLVLMSELAGTTPTWKIIEVPLSLEARLRAFGCYYFFNPQSMDSEFLVKSKVLDILSWKAWAMAGFELDWRNFNDVRSAAVTTYAPVLAGKLQADLGWFRPSLQLETLFYRDGLTARAVVETEFRFDFGVILLKLESSELVSLATGLNEFRWETLGGLRWEF